MAEADMVVAGDKSPRGSAFSRLPGANPRRPRELLWRSIRTHRREVVLSGLLFTSHQLGEALVPVIVGAVVGQAIAHGGTGSIALWVAVLAVDFVFLSFSFRLGARVCIRAMTGVGHTVRMLLTDRTVDPRGDSRHAPGELLSRASSDADRVGAFSETLALAASRVVVLLAATLLLLRFSPLLAAVIVGATLVLIVVQQRVAALLQRRAGVEQGRMADATARAEDTIRGLRVVKGLGAERVAAEGYARTSRTALTAALRSVSAEASMTAASRLITGAYLTAIVGVGGWLALSGRLGIGALISALGLAQFVLGPMEFIASFSAAHARASASAARVAEILDTPAAIDDRPGGPARKDVPTPDVHFERVLLSAGAGPVTFAAPAAEMTGVVVDDAVLMTEITTLLARERDPRGGVITIGGDDVRNWHLEELRRTVLVCPHDAALFDGTVLENVTPLTDDEAGEPDAVQRAVRAAFADQVIDSLPGGADSQVGDRGRRLSGGQRQRVALARALAADAAVLVLHDPTTSVDAATEDEIARRLAVLRTGRTTVLVTTSPALLARCSSVVFIRGSHVRTQTHDELLDGDPEYRQRVAR